MNKDLDAWECKECHGEGWVYVSHDGVDWRDIVWTKETCETCEGLGFCGPDARFVNPLEET